MSRFVVSDGPLAGLKLVRRQRLGDARGFLSRLFCADELLVAGWTAAVAQINHTQTQHADAVRGLHYQHPPHAEMKLVSCLRGEIWDVAVDLRYGSPTFLQWHGQVLSAENGCALLLPPGFAHGYQALCDGVELLYCHSMPYAPRAQAGLHPLDPRLGIAWPRPVRGLSDQDANQAPIDASFEGVKL